MPLGLLLALLGCTTALDPVLEEAWERWKSLYAKEYPGVGPHQLQRIWPCPAPLGPDRLGPASKGSIPSKSPLVLLRGCS